jgi:tRNA U54 and U55 pseudouridine synthase Pus10
MKLHVLASAGTYIKDLVNRDLRRIAPCIGRILSIESEILQLDVSNVFETINTHEETSL